MSGVKKHRFFWVFLFVFMWLMVTVLCLTSETIESAALSLEGIDYIKSSNGLAASVLSVGDGITDDVLKSQGRL